MTSVGPVLTTAVACRIVHVICRYYVIVVVIAVVVTVAIIVVVTLMEFCIINIQVF